MTILGRHALTPEREPVTTESDLELEDVSFNIGGRWALDRSSPRARSAA